MARINNIHTFGWYGTFQREDGICVPCETQSLYEDNGELKLWARGIVHIVQYRGVTQIAWTSVEDQTKRDAYAKDYGPDGRLMPLVDAGTLVKPGLLEYVKKHQSIIEFRCGAPYEIVKKESTPTNWPPVDIDGFVPTTVKTADAGRVVECENCPEALECIC